MIERLATHARCTHKNFQVFYNLILPRKTAKSQWTQSILKIAIRILKILIIPYVEVFLHHLQLQK